MHMNALISIAAVLWLVSAFYIAVSFVRRIGKKASTQAATPLPIHLQKTFWKSGLLWACGGILLLPSTLLTGAAALNYSGYCFEQSRYLTDEERLRSAIEGVLSNYPNITYAYDELPKPGFEVVKDQSRCCGEGDMSRHDKSKGGHAINPDSLVLYRDAQQFLDMNPACCSFDREGLYGEVGSTGMWPKISGYSAGFTNVKFRVRYRDAQGRIQTKFSAESFNLTNCGRGAWPHQS